MADTESKSVVMTFVMEGVSAKVRQKGNKPLKKAMDAACANLNVEKASVRFVYNGQRAREEDTPDSLGMLEEDGFDTEGVEIQVNAFQVGGF